MFKKHILIALAVAGTLAFAEPIERRAATNEFPTPPATVHLTAPMVIKAGTTFTPDQPYTRYDRGSGACKSSGEGGSADAVFHLEEGATISRVVIGKDQMEGIHCLGSCTIDHVYFEDVCEDAITILQTSGTSRINYGGGAQDKIVQHNGAGTVIINSFYAENFGKLYRSCGNCKTTQYTRHVEVNDSWAVSGSALVGINSNYGDTAKIRNLQVSKVNSICDKYTGNNNGKEPTKVGTGPDGTVRYHPVGIIHASRLTFARLELPVQRVRYSLRVRQDYPG
ncbi:pectate lyase C [Ephemerocybe angulata]|uniref:Pectate lyase n=1 Tax=Ephemerocybe angulata TaxID=980116 RepID=A0A8H6I1Q9_9AGAR|nr:pectate lyase C [Tulosesus angulatus]